MVDDVVDADAGFGAHGDRIGVLLLNDEEFGVGVEEVCFVE